MQHLAELIASFAKENNLTEDQVDDLATYMVTYLNIGSPNGKTATGFLQWYQQDLGGSI